MIGAPGSLIEPGDTLLLVLDMAVKGVLVLAISALVVGLLPRASAALRHWVWFLAMGSLLVLPVLTTLLPTWQVTLLPLPVVEQGAAPGLAASGASQPVPIGPPVLVAPTAIAALGEVSTWIMGDRFPFLEAGAGGRSWAAWVLLFWWVGASIVVIRLGVGWVCLLGWAHRAETVSEERSRVLVDQIAKRMGVRRRVRLVRCRWAVMPMTWGLLRPVILLPDGADTWREERLRSVLQHEMAHIRRWDCLTQSLAQIACALYWCNPLVWAAARQLRIEREKACDDQVLCQGAQPSRYASDLLEAARAFRAPRLFPVGAVCMARPSHLERRIRAILAPDSRRRGVGAARAASTLALALLLMGPLAAFSPWSVQTLPMDQAVAVSPAGTTAPSDLSHDMHGEGEERPSREGRSGILPGGREPLALASSAREGRLGRPSRQRSRERASPDVDAPDPGRVIATDLGVQRADGIAAVFGESSEYPEAFSVDFGETLDQSLQDVLDDALGEAFEEMGEVFEDAFEGFGDSLEEAFERQVRGGKAARAVEADLQSKLHALSERIRRMQSDFDDVFVEDLLRIIKADPASGEAREAREILRGMDDPRAHRALMRRYQ